MTETVTHVVEPENELLIIGEAAEIARAHDYQRWATTGEIQRTNG